MMKRWQHWTKGETGQVLPAVLICLALGWLLIVPCVSYAGASLYSSLSLTTNTKGLYAADAGMEDVVWSLKNGMPPRSSLPQNVNGMQVTMQTEDKGDHTLYAGEWVTGSAHSDWLVVSGEMVWDSIAGAYRYTITVTWNGAEGNTKLSEVGAKLPGGYSYQPGSAALFGSNLATNEPDVALNGDGAYLLTWQLPSPTINQDNPIGTQIFYATGTGALEHYYAWAVAQRQDVGTFSQLSGHVYIVTAIATRPEDGEVTARIVADVMLSGGSAYLTSWRVYPE